MQAEMVQLGRVRWAWRRNLIRLSLLFLCGGLVVGFAQGGRYNPDRAIGDTVPAWEGLAGVDGKQHSWSEHASAEFLVVVFTCNSCPYAVDYEERINDLARRFRQQGDKVQLVAINSNLIPEDNLVAMRRRAEKRQFVFPYLFDQSQQVARSFGAVRTPEFFLLDQGRRIRYMGSLDDSSDPTKVSTRYLEDALGALRDERPVPVAETPPVGCMIRYRRSRRSRSEAE